MTRIMKADDFLFIHSMGKALRITAIFTDTDAANAYMENHRDESLIAEFEPFLFLANVYDKGTKVQS